MPRPHRSVFFPMLQALSAALAVALAACAPSAPPSASSSSAQPTSAPPTSAAAPTKAAAPTQAPAAGQATASTSSASKTKLKIAYSAISVSQLPMLVAQNLGYFSDAGLDTDLTYIPTAATAAAAELSGQVPIVTNTQDSVVDSDLKGADLVMLASGPQRLLFSIYTKPSITSVQELKGKKLGVTKVGSATDFAGRWVLTKNHLTAQKDVTIVGVGGVPEILAALSAGGVDAGVLSPPTSFAAEKAGMRVLVDISKEDLPYYGGAVTVSKKWLSQNQDTVRRFMTAWNRAVKLIHDQPDKAAQVLGVYSKQTDQQILLRSVQAVIPILPLDQTPKTDAVNVALQFAAETDPKAKGADPNQFIDTRFATVQ